MITVYTYKGKFGTVPADYIPCLVGFKEGLQPGELDDEAYFETVGEIDPASITAAQRSKWFCSATALITIRYWVNHTPPVPFPDAELAAAGVELTGETKIGYALADELLTAGVNF